MSGKAFAVPLLAIFGIFALILLSGCLSQGCTSDKNCKAWQSCDTVKKSCALKDGYCNVDSECNDTLKTCPVATHQCTFLENRCRNDGDCGSWQVCDAVGNNTCRPRAGYCDQTLSATPTPRFATRAGTPACPSQAAATTNSTAMRGRCAT